MLILILFICNNVKCTIELDKNINSDSDYIDEERITVQEKNNDEYILKHLLEFIETVYDQSDDEKECIEKTKSNDLEEDEFMEEEDNDEEISDIEGLEDLCTNIYPKRIFLYEKKMPEPEQEQDENST